MFAGGSRSFSVFPLRVVYLPVRAGGGCFHSYQCFETPLQTCGETQPRKASDTRGAYRVNKHELLNALAEKKCRLAIAFIYLSDQLTESSVIEEGEDCFGAYCGESYRIGCRKP